MAVIHDLHPNNTRASALHSKLTSGLTDKARLTERLAKSNNPTSKAVRAKAKGYVKLRNKGMEPLRKAYKSAATVVGKERARNAMKAHLGDRTRVFTKPK